MIEMMEKIATAIEEYNKRIMEGIKILIGLK